MDNKNIWSNFKFSDSHEESAFDLLVKQTSYLVEATHGKLKMEVEAVDSYLDLIPPKPVALYMLYVVVPTIGNFRKKILTVVEGKVEGRFPVDIMCHIDDQRDDDVTKEMFLDKVEEILSRPSVSRSIENLYSQSMDNLIEK